jgi:hypothetical protein
MMEASPDGLRLRSLLGLKTDGATPCNLNTNIALFPEFWKYKFTYPVQPLFLSGSEGLQVIRMHGSDQELFPIDISKNFMLHL